MSTTPVLIEHPHPSPNHSARNGHAITAVVIHYTGATSVNSTLGWFATRSAEVSAHVVVDRDGTIYRCVPDYAKAWHAGASTLHGCHVEGSVNAFSLGVELVGTGTDFPTPQLQMAACWVALRCLRYNIPLHGVVGHNAVCVPRGRKPDPGPAFPWIPFLLRVARHLLVWMPPLDPTPPATPSCA